MRRNIRIAKRSLVGRAFLLCLLLVAVGGIGGCGGLPSRGPVWFEKPFIAMR